MEFFELIRSRESVRDYDSDRKIDKKTLLKIAEAGRIAPSAANKQPWEFIIVSSERMLHKINPCYHRPWFKDAPHILIVVGDKSCSWVRQADNYNSLETDLTIAMDHMILAAEDLGIGTCWIAAFDNTILRDALELETNQVVYAITPLGYQTKGFKKQNKKIRKPIEEVIRFI